MNKYNLTALIAVMLFISSCDSFLDEQPRGNAIAETTDHYNGLFNTTEFMNMGMADYAHWLIDQIQLTPECIADFPTTLNNYDQYSVERAFKYQKDVYKVTENCTAWEKCYKNIYTFNVIANGVINSTGGTDAKKKALQAEARVSRAWMHFILAQIFSKPYNADNAETELTIPIVREANSNEKIFERSTMKDLYDFIVTEMEESCPELEDRNDHNMRIYKTTGYALLGKMYWMMGEYEKALKPLRTAYDRLKNETGFYLLDFNTLQEKYGYRELKLDELNNEEQTQPNYLLPYTYASPEILWVKQNTCFSGVFKITYYGLVTYYLKKKCYDLFDDYDLRRNLIPTKDKNNNPYPYPVGCIRDKTTNYGVEIPEVYLALAECEARVGSENNARNLLVEFRKYRMRTGHEELPVTVQTKEDLIKFCLEEEEREFMGRDQRYYNLRRLWNDPIFQDQKPITHNDGVATYTMQEDNLYLQLPESVLKWNESWR